MSKKKLDHLVTLKTLGEFADKVLLPGMEKLVEPLEQRMDKFDQRMDGFDQRMDGFDQRMDRLEGTISKLPDKDYLDRKLAELRGDIISVFRQERTKMRKFGILVAEILRRSDLAKPEEKRLLKRFEVEFAEIL